MASKFILIKGSIFLLSFSIFCSGLAQTPPTEKNRAYSLSYADFISKLAQNNLDYAVEKYNIDIADAEIEAAKILPDPELSFTGHDNQQRRMKMGYGFEAELEWDIELGGKRKARQNLAIAERELAELELKLFFQELRKESTLAFLETLKKKMIFDTKKENYETLLELSETDSTRYVEGKIKKSAATQSRLEALSLYNDMQDAADEWEYSLMDIKNLISRKHHDTLFVPEGNLRNFDRIFELEDLIEIAKHEYGELKISKKSTQVAHHNVEMAKADRVMDLGLSVGVENNAFEKNIIGPTPGHTSVFAGISVPLKFSNNREAGLKNAQYEQEQAELLYQSKQLNLEKEITKAFRNYERNRAQLKATQTVAEEAREVFEEEVKSYFKEEVSLLEVLSAERTYRKIQEDHIDRIFRYVSALVELESCVGIWDIDF